MQLDEPILNITLVFLQSEIQLPKIGFSTKSLEFLENL
jgi:hypothetical protein